MRGSTRLVREKTVRGIEAIVVSWTEDGRTVIQALNGIGKGAGREKGSYSSYASSTGYCLLCNGNGRE